MATKLIELQDGILVEVESDDSQYEAISSKTADKVAATFDKIKPLLVKVSTPIADAWTELNKDMIVEGAEIELGFSFEAEGNLYLTKAKASANMTVKFILKPPQP